MTAAGEDDRIAALDLIRGLGVLGILLVNAIAFAQPIQVYDNPTLSPVALSHADLATWWAIATFCRDKFVTLFSLLFGVSLFLVGREQRRSDPAYRTPLFRRLAWLALFGLVHGAVIWLGDILLLYAVTGFIFWRWRHAATGRLLAWGASVFLLGAACQVLPFILQPDLQPSVTDIRPQLVIMRGDVLSSLGGNARAWAHGVFGNLTFFLPTTLGLMMLGLGLFKGGFLRGTASARIYVAAMAAAAVCLVVIGVQARVIMAHGCPFPQTFGIYGVANTVLCLPVALGYAGALILADRTALGHRLLHPLACAGRMAFTNYLTQSLVMTMLFYGGRGPGLFGTMNPWGLVPVVVAIWIAQLAVSTAWLSHFRYGPFEWGWRCLTYGRRVAMVRSSPTSASGR